MLFETLRQDLHLLKTQKNISGEEVKRKSRSTPQAGLAFIHHFKKEDIGKFQPCSQHPPILSMSFIILWMHDFPFDLHRPSRCTLSCLSLFPGVIHSLSFTVQCLLQHRQALQTCETKTCQLSRNSYTVSECTNQKLIMTEGGIKTARGRLQGRQDEASSRRRHVLRAWRENVKQCQSGRDIKILSERHDREVPEPRADRAAKGFISFCTSHDMEQMEQCSTTIRSLHLLRQAERAQYSSLLTVK